MRIETDSQVRQYAIVKSIKATNGGGDPNYWLAKAGAIAITTSAADGPIPMGEVLGLAMIGATLIKQSIKRSQGGNPNYPSPWYTARPNSYIPPPVPGFNNRNYFPNGNGNDFTKWVIRIGASVLAKCLYDAFSVDEQYYVVPQDNTYIQPAPFLTPIPDPYKGY